MSDENKETETYFFKCIVKRITYSQGGDYELEVIPITEYTVKRGDNTYVAFMPNTENANGLLLKYDNAITIKNIKDPLCALKCSNNWTVYVKATQKDEVNVELCGGKYYGITKISVEV